MHWAFLLLLAALPLPSAKGPAPEVAKLGAYLGVWNSTGVMVASPFSKPGRTSFSSTCRWSPNQEFLICDQRIDSASGPSADLCVYGYDRSTKSYIYYQINAGGGQAISSPLKIEGNLWTYPSQSNVGKSTIHFRTINVFDSPDRVTYRVEYSEDGQHWKVMGAGESRRAPKK